MPMEITKEYFEQQLEQQFVRLTGYIDGKLTNLATKDDLKNSLTAQAKQLENYVDEMCQGIIEAMDHNFSKVNHRLDNLELDMSQVKSILRLPQNAHK